MEKNLHSNESLFFGELVTTTRQQQQQQSLMGLIAIASDLRECHCVPYCCVVIIKSLVPNSHLKRWTLFLRRRRLAGMTIQAMLMTNRRANKSFFPAFYKWNSFCCLLLLLLLCKASDIQSETPEKVEHQMQMLKYSWEFRT